MSRSRLNMVPQGAVSAEEIEAAKTPAGGWTREVLAGWGVPWPPPTGWRKRLTAGPAHAADALVESLPSFVEELNSHAPEALLRSILEEVRALRQEVAAMRDGGRTLKGVFQTGEEGAIVHVPLAGRTSVKLKGRFPTQPSPRKDRGKADEA